MVGISAGGYSGEDVAFQLAVDLQIRRRLAYADVAVSVSAGVAVPMYALVVLHGGGSARRR